MVQHKKKMLFFLYSFALKSAKSFKLVWESYLTVTKSQSEFMVSEKKNEYPLYQETNMRNQFKNINLFKVYFEPTQVNLLDSCMQFD